VSVNFQLKCIFDCYDVLENSLARFGKEKMESAESYSNKVVLYNVLLS
jgi:hypothetical protein